MNHPKVLAVLHRAVAFRSKSQRYPGSVGSGSVVIPVGFTSPIPWFWGTVLAQNDPSLCSLISHFCWRPHVTVFVWAGEVISGLNASFSHKLCSFLT